MKKQISFIRTHISKIICLSIILLYVNVLCAQSKDVAEHSEVTLPNWILESQGNGRYVGVSDPYLSEDEAFTQALLRAWMLFNIDNQATIKGSSSYYQQNSNGVYESATVLSSSSLNRASLCVGREFVSKYGEYYIEFFVDRTVTGRYYTFESNVNDAEFNFKEYVYCEYDSSKHNTLTSLNGYIHHPVFGSDLLQKEIKSEPVNSTEDIVSFTYKSTRPDDPKPTQGKNLMPNILSSSGMPLTPSSLECGYWFAFISSLMSEAEQSDMSYRTDVTYSENLCETNFDIKNIENYSSNQIQLSLSGVQIKSNQLYIEWDSRIVEEK